MELNLCWSGNQIGNKAGAIWVGNTVDRQTVGVAVKACWAKRCVRCSC
jgi:hypothetical protein